MEKHKCKLCLRSFTNGRALGGHMRSHMLNLYVNPKPPHSPSQSLSSSSFSSRNGFPTVRKRSRRVRRPESCCSPEEVVAYCLMMLSRDKWTDNESESELELELESDPEVIKPTGKTTRNGYKCETCNRSFRSYQALGGHIASHKKIKVNQETINVSIEDKVYECHMCFKVFASGQALGGHKRSHVTGKQVVKERINMIDLNLPASSDVSDGEFGSFGKSY